MISSLQTRNQYRIIYKIGSGQFCNIYMARYVTTNDLVMVKIYNLDDPRFAKSNPELKSIQGQTTMWLDESHPNLMQYYGSFWSGSQLWIISEFMDCGCLTDALSQLYPKGIDNEVVISTILKPVLLLLSYLHRNSKACGCVCPSNIFLSTEGNVKMNMPYFLASELKGQYISPEQLSKPKQSQTTQTEAADQKSIDPKTGIDVWDVGITAIELAIGRSPENSDVETIRSKNSLPNCSLSSSFFDFVNCCIKANATKRPTVDQLLQHKFIKTALDQSYLQAMLTILLPPMNKRFGIIDKEENANVNLDAANEKVRPKFVFDEEIKEKAQNIDENVPKNVNLVRGRVTLSGPEELLKEYIVDY